jgi:non-specific serine/threonine protein kinase
MLEMIREYALELLAASGEATAIRHTHAEVFLSLVEAAEAQLEGAEQAAWLNRLQQEHDNLRMALDWVVEQGEANTGLRFARALRLFWFMRGHLTEGRRRVGQILGLAGGSAADRAKALDSAGFLARYQGDYRAAVAFIEESLTLWRALGDIQGIADALSNLGYVSLHQGDYIATRALYQESLDLNRQIGNDQGCADCLSHLGSAAFYQGDTSTAQALHQESLAIWRRLGDLEGVAYALNNIGDLLFAHADYAAAAQQFQEALATSMDLAWAWGVVCAVEGVAGLAVCYRRHEAAVQIASFAARLRTNVAIPPSLARQEFLARRLAPARQALSEASYTAAWTAGHAYTLEQAVVATSALLTSLSAEMNAPDRPSIAPQGQRAELSGLTAREREVAILIAQGHSNRAIAATLVVGIKTVEAHASRILAKLGFTSRAQIAAWAVAKGLAAAPNDLDSQRL